MNTHHPLKGSVLMVAMILGMALAIIVGSYVSLSMSTMNNANRSFHYNTAFNLAEAGIEEALWALNNRDWSKRNWSDTGSGMQLIGTSDLTYANHASGHFKVYVGQVSGGFPVITAEGMVQPPNGAAVRKQIRVNAKNANVFMPPFTAITSLDLNGGEIDSYQMDPNQDGVNDQNYVTAPRRYETTVASPTVTIGDIDIGSPADIYGFVNVGVGTANADGFISSVKGSITGPATVAGQNGVIQSGSNLVDTNRVAFDFAQTFPAPDAPTGAFIDPIPNADANGMIVLGDKTGATTKRYQLTNYSVPNGNTLLIVGPVEIKALGNLTVGGQAAITVLDGSFSATPKKGEAINYTSAKASATIYAYGDLSISGNGALTGGTIPGVNIGADPTKLMVYGMSATTQALSIGGNGNLAASVYAPHASVRFNGGGSSGYFAGAVVSDTITVNGNGYRIRFPEEMANMGTSSTYQITSWTELIDHSAWHTF